MTLLESSMHSSSDLPETDEHEPSEGADEGNETDGDSGSYMSSSFYASDQGEDSEDESQPHGPAKVTSPPLPPVPVQPTNTLPGLPFLPLKEISSYLSLEDLASLYRTHRQLRSTIDEGSQSFFGRFWTYSPKSEWVNRARRAHGWHEPIVAQEEEEEEQEAGTVGDGRRRERASRHKMSEIGMDEFWKQIRSAFWVTSFPWDRNDRAMIQQSFWSNLLSPENSPPPEPSPSKFSSSSSPSPVPQSQTRILRPTLSAGYRAYAQHGYVLTGVHHLLLLQRQVCWQCLFCPEEGSQGPEIKILKGGGGGRGRTVGLATTTTNAEDAGEGVGAGPGAGASSPSSKVCEGCGAAACGRHPTSSETARSLAVELSFLPTPPPAHGHFLFHTLQSMRDVIVASSQGQNPLQVYYRRRNAADENSDWVAAHFGAAQAQAAFAAGFGGGLGGGGGNGAAAAAAAAGGGNVGAGGGPGGGPGPAPVPAGFGGAFIPGGGGGAFFGGGPGAGVGAGPFGAIGVGGANANANPNHPFLAPPPPPPPVHVVVTIGNPPPPAPPVPQPQLLPQFQQAQAQAQQPNPFPVPVPVQPQPQPQPLPPGFHVAHNPYQHGGGPGERPAMKDLWVCAQCAKQFGGFGWSRRGANGADGF